MLWRLGLIIDNVYSTTQLPLTFYTLAPRGPVAPTCSSVSFPLWHEHGCLCDSEGGESVTHANASRQLCVCLLAISCVPGLSVIGSCPLHFLSLELREGLTLRLSDTGASCTRGPLSGPRTIEIEIFYQKVTKNTLTITHSWSNVQRGITDDWCNWHCITNLT